MSGGGGVFSSFSPEKRREKEREREETHRNIYIYLPEFFRLNARSKPRERVCSQMSPSAELISGKFRLKTIKVLNGKDAYVRLEKKDQEHTIARFTRAKNSFLNGTQRAIVSKFSIRNEYSRCPQPYISKDPEGTSGAKKHSEGENSDPEFQEPKLWNMQLPEA
ncbi:hypothetical protein K438DRAFT_1746699 [Mycena galopus ATCC 62051]|nr:hypothetical protein K438DRAFT_1746699 [Mycena galopus ATCC 62051]